MNWIQAKAFDFVIPMVLGPLVYVIVKYLKSISGWIDAQSPAIKRTLVVAISILVTAGTNLVGQPVTCSVDAVDAAECLGQLTPEVLKAILASGTAFLLHALKKAQP
jgi:hypothetical protein